MTISNPELPQRPTQPNPEAWLPEDEIDLREYVLVLVAWWREIVLIAVGVALIAALAVLALRLIISPFYESSATVAIARTQSNITFDTRFTTLSAEDAASLQQGSAARRAALLGLVVNGAVAQAVIDQLGDLLDEEERNPAALLANERVSAELVGGSGNQAVSDLIRITVKADSAPKAAAIVNAWAENYVTQVNRIYGQVPGELVASIASELTNAQTEYNSAQSELEAFVASNQVDRLGRLIVEKQDIIASLQSAQANNRLLAFQKEQEAKRALVSALIEADTASRLHALQSEQAGKTKLFDAYAQADIQAKLAVFNEETQSRLQLLSTYYETRAKLQRLRGDAVNLRLQSAQAGEAGAATNSLALLLLKVQVYATSTSPAALPSDLQITLADIGDINAGAPGQLTDLDGLVQALESRLAQLDLLIADQSNRLLTNGDYNFISDPAGGGAEGSELVAAVQERYRQLFALSPLATESLAISTTTPIYAAIRAQYPDLFDIGALAALSDGVSADNPLAALGSERAKELLQLQGLEDLPAYTAAAEPLTRAIDQLESDIQALQAQQEAESSRRQQLAQRRDLAWSTLTTLQNKSAELQLSSTATNSEVRLAAPGVEPIDPVKGLGLITTTALAGIVGLMLAVFVVFFANFMGAQPWLGRRTEVGI